MKTEMEVLLCKNIKKIQKQTVLRESSREREGERERERERNMRSDKRLYLAVVKSTNNVRI